MLSFIHQHLLDYFMLFVLWIFFHWYFLFSRKKCRLFLEEATYIFLNILSLAKIVWLSKGKCWWGNSCFLRIVCKLYPIVVLSRNSSYDGKGKLNFQKNRNRNKIKITASTKPHGKPAENKHSRCDYNRWRNYRSSIKQENV